MELLIFMAHIKGISVIVYKKIETGKDAFNNPIYAQQAVIVENVLVCPVSSSDVTDKINLTGKKEQYELCIPKEDSNNWEDVKVRFFDKDWQTVGFPQQYISENVPLAWNKKIKVERYG